MNKYQIVPNYFLLKNFEQINQKDSFSCLEVGCNTGHNLKAIRDLFPNAQYYGIDINKEAIIQGRENCENVYLMTGDIEKECLTTISNLPNPVLFDYILLPDVLQHLNNPEKTLIYLEKFLAPGGTIFVAIPNVMHWSILYKLLHYGLFTYTDTGLLDSDHKHLFTNNEFIMMCNRTGFKIIKSYGIDINNNIYNEEIREFINQLSSYGQPGDSYKFFSYHFVIKRSDDD